MQHFSQIVLRVCTLVLFIILSDRYNYTLHNLRSLLNMPIPFSFKFVTLSSIQAKIIFLNFPSCSKSVNRVKGLLQAAN